jgi:hypothetical protein
MEDPLSSYSALLIHCCWKVPSAERMLAPIQEENLRSSAEAVRILGLKAEGMSVSASQYRRLERPDRLEPPPVRTPAGEGGERARARVRRVSV